MSKAIGEVVKTTSSGSTVTLTINTSGISAVTARSKARNLARAKGFSSPSVTSIGKAGSGRLPGVKSYRITVEAMR